jgi:hypothetical protein
MSCQLRRPGAGEHGAHQHTYVRRGTGDQLVVHVNSRGVIEITEADFDRLLLELGHAETQPEPTTEPKDTP